MLEAIFWSNLFFQDIENYKQYVLWTLFIQAWLLGLKFETL